MGTAGEFIDVSKYQGQMIEVLFGFSGQTASESNIAVRGLRFFTRWSHKPWRPRYSGR
ncbi:MAG: hypothetical protein ACJAQT_002958 [Akkermansiaceae bacterium]|jgi:hypothetical protein